MVGYMEEKGGIRSLMKKKIMILTAPFGNGHVQVAKQLVEEMKVQTIDYVLYDIFSEEYGVASIFLERFHVNQYKRGLAQQTYKFVYYNSDRLLKSWIAKYYNQFGLKRLIAKINEEKPDAIINTFPVNCSYFLKSKNMDIPVYTVITDYYANANWISKSVKRHFLSSENVVGQLVKRDIADHQIQVTGIPTRSIFYRDRRSEVLDLKQKYEINLNSKVVLLVAGAKGVVPKFKSIIKLMMNHQNITLMIICGNNKSLYRQINKRFSHLKHIKIFGFVKEIDELMAISDVMVTKPGGITITEASQVGLPLVLFKPIFGQELENAIYFASREAALIAYNERQVVEEVLTLVNDEARLNRMKANIKRVSKKYAANTIINSIMNDFNG
jgi:processive 1,2-diacylglycerol beta-glucosyltransferase